MEGALTKGDQQRAEEFDRIHQEAAAKLTLGGKNHPSAKELASGYTKGKRIWEVSCVLSSLILNLCTLWFLGRSFEWRNITSLISGTILGIFSADFVSGLVHWGADSYGSVSLPILGKVKTPYTEPVYASHQHNE
jgi:ubiquitin-conjugating enzyme E2 variant